MDVDELEAEWQAHENLENAYADEEELLAMGGLDFTGIGLEEDEKPSSGTTVTESSEHKHKARKIHANDSSPSAAAASSSSSSSSSSSGSATTTTRTDEFVLLRPPNAGDFLSVTGADGKRVFLKLQTNAEHEERFRRRMRRYKRGVLSVRSDEGKVEHVKRSLLETSVAAMAMELAKEAVDRELVKAEKEEALSGTAERKLPRGDGKLWVNKYAPETYIDLLSSEKINRNVLGWLKSWDRTVFPDRASRQQKSNVSRKFLSVAAQEANNEQASGGHTTSNKRGAQFKSEAPKVDHRPEKKVVLLSGPPGLGKTTLAHILARHAGYNPVEINASDDRTADMMKKRISGAVTMNQLFAERKPNCLILDEIDGAMGSNATDSKGSINALIDVVNATGSKKGLKKLTRPIICICNDVYAPALRPLRQIALCFTLTPPHVDKLVARLQVICKRERMLVDRATLNNLSTLFECDIRSCINTLQMLKNKGKQRVTMKTLRDMNLGHKDVVKDKFSIWEMVFSTAQDKRSTLMDAQRREENKDKQRAEKERLEEMDPEVRAMYSRMVERNNNKRSHCAMKNAKDDAVSIMERKQLRVWGDLERVFSDFNAPHTLVEGIFHNSLSQQRGVPDPTLMKMVDVSAWISLSDTLPMTMQNSYTPFMTALPVRMLLGKKQRPRLELPSVQYEVKKHTQINDSIADHCLQARDSVLAKLGISKRVLVLDYVSHILDIVLPCIASGHNTTLLSTKDQSILRDVVQLMVDLDLTYIKDFSYDFATKRGGYSGGGSRFANWVMEPNLAALVDFQSLEIENDAGASSSSSSSSAFTSPKQSGGGSLASELATPVRELPAKVRETLRREVEVERFRRVEKQLWGNSSSSEGRDNDGEFSSAESKLTAAPLSLPQRAPAALPKVIKHKEKKVADHFLSRATNDRRDRDLNNRVFYNIHYKYHEGFSRSVRRRVNVSHFMDLDDSATATEAEFVY